MRTIKTILLAAVVAATLAAPAYAGNPDGRVYAYEDAWFKGDYCYWTGDNYDWRYAEWAEPHAGTCPGRLSGFNDVASSVANHGFTRYRPDVEFYRDVEKGGPWMCLRNGEQWADLSLGYERFSDGENANDKISGHRWTTCP